MPIPDPTLPYPTDAISVAELFTKLSFGPLSNLSMGGEGSGQIAEGSQGKIINYINDGLIKLYTRFILREKEVIIRCIGGRTHYQLYKRFAESRTNTDSTDPIFIMDELDPFQQDVIKILDVYSPEGFKHPLNDEENTFSLFTPYVNVLQVPRPHEGHMLSVMYQARHRKLEYGVTSALIYLPEVLHEALVSYIAAQVFSHMNGPENTVKGAEHLGKFESSCSEIEDKDLVSTATSTTNSVFNKRGWV